MSYFEINNVNIVTSWTWDLPLNQDCTICRESLNTFSIYNKGGECIKISKGECGHMFHRECIVPWLKTQNKCPICSEKITKLNDL